MYSMQLYLIQFVVRFSEFSNQIKLAIFEIDLNESLKIHNYNLVIEYIFVEDINTINNFITSYVQTQDIVM
jgi:hypothetical protein